MVQAYGRQLNVNAHHNHRVSIKFDELNQEGSWIQVFGLDHTRKPLAAFAQLHQPEKWWAKQDLNLQPTNYEFAALTN
jgi:hypothetical protein